MSPVQFRMGHFVFYFVSCDEMCVNLCKAHVKVELSGKPWSDSCQLRKGPAVLLYAVMADTFVFSLIPFRTKGYTSKAYVGNPSSTIMMR